MAIKPLFFMQCQLIALLSVTNNNRIHSLGIIILGVDWMTQDWTNNVIKISVSVTGPVVAQRVGRGIALLFHDHRIRREWLVSSTRRPYFTLGKNPVPIVQEAGWAPGPAWTGGKSLPAGIRSPDRPARSQSFYRLSYPAHRQTIHVFCK